MKYLIIGGTGNLSDGVVDWLNEKGHEVSCITRGNQFKIERAKRKRGVRFINVKDISGSDDQWITQLDSNYNIIVDFLCYSDKDLRFRMKWLVKRCTKAYVLISTTAFYQRSRELKESYEEEGIQVCNDWEYASLKYEAEKYLKDETQRFDCKTVVIRLGHTIGSLVPVNLGNPGHAYMDFLRKTCRVPFIGSIDQSWMVGSSKGLSEILDSLHKVVNSLDKHEVFHYSSVITTWREIYECLFRAMDIGEPLFVEKQMRAINEITPEWIPSIKYHKIFPDIYNTSKLTMTFGTQKKESIQAIVSRSYLRNKKRDLEKNYEQNMERMIKILDG